MSADKEIEVAKVDLEFLAGQIERVLNDVAGLEDDVTVALARLGRIDATAHSLVTEVRAMPSRHDRLSRRVDRLEEAGTPMTSVRPIRSEGDYRAALAEVKRLWGAGAGTPEGDRLDVLATLIDAYEAAHDAMDPPDPIEAIRFRMEQQGLTRKDLERVLACRARHLGRRPDPPD